MGSDTNKHVCPINIKLITALGERPKKGEDYNAGEMPDSNA